MQRTEMETSIVFDAENDHAIIWTAYPPMQTKLAKLGLVGKPIGPGLQFEVPKKWIRISKPRQMSAERRETLRQNALSRGFGKVRTFVSEENAEDVAQSTHQ